MSRTNFDYLLQATVPIGERGIGGLPRAEEALPPFDEHLSKASSTASGSSTTTTLKATLGGAPVSTSGGTTNNHTATSSEPSTNDSLTSTAAASHEEDESDTDASTAVDENAATDTDASDTPSAKDVIEANTDESDDEDQVEASEMAAAVAEGQVATAAAEVKVAEEVVQAVGEAAAQAESAEEAAGGDEENAGKLSRRSPGDPTEAMADASAEGNSTAAELTTTAEENASDPAAVTAKMKTRGGKRSDANKAVSGDDVLAKAGADGASIDDASVPEIAADGSQQSKADAAIAIGEKPAAVTDNSDSDKSARSSVRHREVVEAVANKVAAVAVPNVETRPQETGAVKESNESAAPAKAVAAKGPDATEAVNRLQPGTSAAKRGVQAGGGEELPRIDPARFVGRVAKAFHTANERGGTLQLRLSPPELGAMRIELTVKDGVMTANLETENAAARRVLLDHLPALRERLAEQNIRVERFDVDVRREGTGGQADPRAAQDQQQSQQGHTSRRAPAARAVAVQPSPIAPALPQNITTSTGINVVA